jgi:hypothetical protein
MYRRFIATITAAAIAITAIGALPAAADERDTARALAAILGLAVVGKIIHDNRKDDRVQRHQPAPVYRQKQHKQQVYNPPRYQNQHVQPRPLPQRVDRKLLPGQCLRSFDTRGGKVRMFGRKCLNNNYQYTRRLPQQCLQVFRTNRGDRQGYEARCLRQNGYSLARG